MKKTILGGGGDKSNMDWVTWNSLAWYKIIGAAPWDISSWLLTIISKKKRQPISRSDKLNIFATFNSSFHFLYLIDYSERDASIKVWARLTSTRLLRDSMLKPFLFSG